MTRLWLRLRCTLARHPVTVVVVEKHCGRFHAVSETCACGRRQGPKFPGALFKAHTDAYKEYPTEFEDFF